MYLSSATVLCFVYRCFQEKIRKKVFLYFVSPGDFQVMHKKIFLRLLLKSDHISCVVGICCYSHTSVQITHLMLGIFIVEKTKEKMTGKTCRCLEHLHSS